MWASEPITLLDTSEDAPKHFQCIFDYFYFFKRLFEQLFLKFIFKQKLQEPIESKEISLNSVAGHNINA